jgi:predicted DCC family thiol-disulfide oxidoreductase YuxK
MSEQPTLLLYDADCGFCRWAVAKLLAWDRARRLQPLRIQSAEGQRLLAEVEPRRRLASWHLLTPDGCIHSAGAGAAPLMRLLRGGAPLALLATAFSGATERAYQAIARNRSRPGRLIPRSAKERATRRIEEREFGSSTQPPLSARPC